MLFTCKITTLTYNEVAYGLLSMGFTHIRTTSSHEQWVGYRGGKKMLVTLDKPQSPYRIKLIESMAKQAQVDKRKFFLACKGKLDVNDHPYLLVTKNPND